MRLCLACVQQLTQHTRTQVSQRFIQLLLVEKPTVCALGPCIVCSLCCALGLRGRPTSHVSLAQHFLHAAQSHVAFDEQILTHRVEDGVGDSLR